MMRTYIIFLLISCIFVPLEAKYTKRQKTIIKKFKKQRQIAYDLEVELNSLNTTLDELKKLTEVSTRHRFNVDSLTVVDATFTGTQCGPFTLSSYTTNINWYSAAADADNDVADPFSGGTFTSQTNGWYHICSFSRFRGTGNSNDNTVRVGGSIVAAYGSGITEDWLTNGICFDTYLAQNTQVQVRHESGGGSDCIENTGWNHNKFTVHTIGNGNP